MKENLQKAHTAIDALVEDIKRLVRENGGIVDTQVKGCFRIMSYIIDYDDDIVECQVMGVKVENDTLYVLPDYAGCYFFGETNIKEVEDSEWYAVNRYASDILANQTILCIAEHIDQYV